jgi:hypothetical protein
MFGLACFVCNIILISAFVSPPPKAAELESKVWVSAVTAGLSRRKSVRP